MLGRARTLLDDSALLFTDAASRAYVVRRYIVAPVLRLVSWLLALAFPFVPRSLAGLDRPIFIIGCSRSGTDIFVDLFSQHAQVANWSEAAQIFELDYYNPLIDHYKDGSDASRFESIRLGVFFSLFVRLSGGGRFVNKHPQNSFRIEYLKTLFPDAFFIHVIRDGRAVVFSTMAKAQRERFRQKYPFGNFPKPVRWREYVQHPPLEQYALQWRDTVAYIRETARRVLSEKTYIEVTYEDLCDDTHSMLSRLDAFCALDQEKRRYAKIPATLQVQNYKWRAGLAEAEIARVEAITGEWLQKTGYDCLSPLANRKGSSMARDAFPTETL